MSNVVDTDPVSLVVMDRIVAACRTINGLRGATYDEPFDFERSEQPWCWVYDFGEDYDEGRTVNGRFDPLVNVATLISYRYDEQGSQSLRRQAHRWRTELLRTLYGTHDEADYNHALVPERSAIQDLAQHAPRLGMVVVVWALDYGFNVATPYGVQK